MQVLSKVYLCGIKPSRVHLGHLLSVVDRLNKSTKDNVCVLIADGHKLSTERSMRKIDKLSCKLANLFDQHVTVYKQSEVSGSYFDPYLIVSSLVDKKDLEKIFSLNKKFSYNNFLMFSYPVLMALDVVLMAPCRVLVGEDQIHNVRFVKLVLERIKKFLNISFDVEFEIVRCRIKSFVEDLKMSSTTLDEKGCIYMDLDDSEIVKRVMSAKTQSDLPASLLDASASLRNLYQILSLIDGKSEEAVFSEYCGLPFSTLKAALAEKICAYVGDHNLRLKANASLLNRQALPVEDRISFNSEKIKKAAKEA